MEVDAGAFQELHFGGEGVNLPRRWIFGAAVDKQGSNYVTFL